MWSRNAGLVGRVEPKKLRLNSFRSTQLSSCAYTQQASQRRAKDVPPRAGSNGGRKAVVSAVDAERFSDSKYELRAPLFDDIVALDGRIRRTSLRKFERKAPGTLQQNSSYYDLTSTRPPALLLPDSLAKKYRRASPPFAERAKHVFSTARAYLTFYKTGLKQIWSNFKEYRVIAPRAREFDRLHWTTPETELISKMKQFRDRSGITRREYNLYLRTRRDLQKLLPFGLLLLVFGEFSPLILLPLGPRVIPFPCLIPKQVYQYLAKGDPQPTVELREVPEGSALTEDLSMIPSFTTWQEFDEQLRTFDRKVSAEPGMEHTTCISRTWWRPSRPSPDRPLADALLVLWEGGVDTLDDKEVLMWVWNMRDLYLRRGLWTDALFSRLGLDIEKDLPSSDHEVEGWSNIGEVDLYDVRQELQLTLEELVSRVDHFLSSGLDRSKSGIQDPKVLP